MAVDPSRISTTDTSDSMNEVLVQQLDNLKTPEDTVKFYNTWAFNYEADLNKVQYNHPRLLANYIAEFMKSKKISPESTKLLDVCAGTGLVSHWLRKHNITNVDALDASEKMLELAKERNLYNNYFCELVTDECLKTVDKDVYDIVCTTGSFCPGQMNSKSLRTLNSIIKPGGYLFISMRSQFLEHPYLQDLEDTMNQIEEEKLWKRITREKMENYFDNFDGTLYVYQKL